MRYLSVCSGIEAATVAWRPLGWRPVAFSEIEAFPSAVLAHHYPDVPNLGDMTNFRSWPDAAIDLLVGGTPCQSFSVAGLRKGLDDPRGNLALTYLAIAERYRPRWLVWENVPGVLSSNGGRDFGTFLGGLGQLGYGFAYRVLDAQYFGVAQRRRRVFVVGCLGDWRRAAAVLFERHSLSGHPAPSREAGKGATHDTAPCLTSSGRGVERTGDTRGQDPVVAVAFGGNNQSGPIGVTTALNTCASASSGGGDKPYVLYGVADTLTSHWHRSNGAKAGNNSGMINPVYHDMRVRRLTPRECERLQGFPDDYTRIPWRGKPAELCPDDPRYKALGNSMAVPVMRWIGERIEQVHEIASKEAAA